VPTTTASRGGARGPLRRRAERIVVLLLASQVAVALALALALATWGTGRAAYSALVGALIWIVPNYYLAGRLRRRVRGAAAALVGIYTGEFVKIALTAMLFVVAIKLLDVDFLIIVATYAAMVMVNWLALLVVDLGESPSKPTPG
jgi:ATP synthase protein I